MKRTHNKNKALYEAIMKDVAVIVKKHLNELSPATIARAWQKKNQLGDNREYDYDYNNLVTDFKFIPEEPLTVFDEFIVNIYAADTRKKYPELELLTRTIHLPDGEQIYLRYLGDMDMDTNTIINVVLYGRSPYRDDDQNKTQYLEEPGFHLFSTRDARRLANILNKEYGFNFSYRLFVTDRDHTPDGFGAGLREEIENL